MMNFTKFFLALGLFIFPLFNSLFAWGSLGHRMVNRVAIELLDNSLKPFFAINTDTLQRLGNVPDAKWKQSETYQQERYQHFFQWDRYSTSALAENMPVDLTGATQLVGKDFIVVNGTTVWRASQIYELLVAAMKARDWTKCLQMAGVIGHYIGDLSQPMHVTSDYDGQSIGRRGVHTYYEATILNHQDQETLFRQVLNAAQGGVRKHSNLSIIGAAFEESKRALAKLPELLVMLNTDTPDESELAAHAVLRMADGAATLTNIWNQALIDSGIRSGIPSTQMDVVDPEWIPTEVNALNQ